MANETLSLRAVIHSSPDAAPIAPKTGEPVCGALEAPEGTRLSRKLLKVFWSRNVQDRVNLAMKFELYSEGGWRAPKRFLKRVD